MDIKLSAECLEHKHLMHISDDDDDVIDDEEEGDDDDDDFGVKSKYRKEQMTLWYSNRAGKCLFNKIEII